MHVLRTARVANRFIGLPVLVVFWATVLVAHAGSAPWDGQPRPIQEIRIDIEDPYPDTFDWQGLAIAMIPVERGDLLSKEALEQAEQALSPFARVRSSVDVRPEGVNVVFILEPYKLIHSVAISGNYPLLEREVRNSMTVFPGDFFFPDDMPKQEALVAEYFRGEGYVDPKVDISWTQREEDGHFRLEVAIDKGPFRSLEQLRVFGNHAFSDSTIRLRMSSWRREAFWFGSARFTERRLREDIRRLTGYYRGKGFGDVAISTQIESDPQTPHGIVCELTILEGPRYEIAFDGNQFFSNRALRREVVLFEAGNRGNIGLRRSVNNIRRRYLEAGFADVQVRWRDALQTQNGQALRLVTLEIEEGQRHIVEQVILRGHRSFDADRLRGQMLTRPPQRFRAGAYAAEVLMDDLEAIRALYYSEGFLEARAIEEVRIDPQSARVDIYVTIEEGPQTRVGGISLEGDPPVAKEKLEDVLEMDPGEPYLPVNLRDDEDRLASRISLLGYPHVRARATTTLSEDRTRADIVHNIDSGPHVRVGEIFFLGNFRTRDRFMHRELGIRPETPFVLQEVWEAQRNLRDLNIFETVQVRSIGLRERQDTVHLVVQASEMKPYYFEAGGGYQTDTGFFGRLRIGDRNFLGTAKDVWTSAQLSEIGYRWDAGITDPRLLGTRIRADAGLFAERTEPFNQLFGTQSSGAHTNFARGWGRFITTSLALRYEYREQFLRARTDAVTDIDPATLEPRSIVVVTPFVQYDNRDSFIRPQRGYLFNVGVDISKGLDNNLDDFVKYRVDARTYRTPMEGLTLAARAWVGVLEPYGGDELPLDQLFFLGGTNTVRGFGENLLRFDADGAPVGGRLAIVASLEARFAVGRNFELVPFVDTGSVRQALTDFGSDDWRWSTGLGLQYLTPIGPVGLFYGHKLDRQPGESSGQFHLSIGYTY
jgi:outer membrane protein insertion porin family